MSNERRFIVMVSNFSLMSFLLFWGPFVWVSQAQDLPPEVLNYAEMVLYNGQVLTMDRDQPPITVTQAIALRDGRVLAVGDSDRILQMAGPDTTKVDLEGRAVIPGIIDTHSHPNQTSFVTHGVMPSLYLLLVTVGVTAKLPPPRSSQKGKVMIPSLARSYTTFPSTTVRSMERSEIWSSGTVM